MTSRTWVAVVLAAALCPPAAAQPLYFAGDGSALSSSKWGTSSGGPFDQPFTAGSVATFAAPNGTGTGGSIVVGGITATENFTLTAISGTISNQGNGVVTVSAAGGKTLDFGAQSFTSSTTAGYVKTGPGVLALAGNTYQGGFTLNEGTVIVRGVNAMGGGAANTLTINGGTIAANNNRDLSGKYGGGITVGGNFTLGASTGLADQFANLRFHDVVNLGGGNRTITVGARGTYTFGHVLTNGGLTVAATDSIGKLVLAAGGTYTGGTTVLAGARLQIGEALSGPSDLAGNVTNHGEMTFFETGSSSYGGVISGTGTVIKMGAGVMTLTGASTYTGKTVVAAPALEVSTLANVGQPSNIGAGTTSALSLVINGGTLRYVGPGVSTDRPFSLGGSSESRLDASGTGPVVFANTGTIGYDGFPGNVGFYLEGTNTGGNTLALKLVDPSGGALSVRKIGSGTWALNGDNTNTGLTAVFQGTLLVNGTQSGTGLGASVSQDARLGGSGTINGGVTVQAATTTDQRGARVRGGVPGKAGMLTFNGNAWVAASTTSATGKLRGGGFEVEASRTGAGAAEASRVAFNGSVNFRDLAAGTPTTGDPKFVIELADGATPLRVGESYTIVLATASEFQRNGVRVGESSTYTFDPNDYVLTSSDFAGFTGASLQVVGGNTLQLTFTPVPEPTAGLGLAVVGLGAAWLRRRGRR